MSASSTGLLAAEGPGSVSQAPNLADGFTDMFTSRYVDAGALRLHAVIGGDGPPLLLVHGWPQTWYAWRLMMPALAENFEVIAVDQRGMGLSDKPRDSYDTASVANDLVALMDALGSAPSRHQPGGAPRRSRSARRSTRRRRARGAGRTVDARSGPRGFDLNRRKGRISGPFVK